MRIFAPGFGAGAVAGYTVMRIDPAVVAVPDARPLERRAQDGTALRVPDQSSEDVRVAFG